ncbi:hypothetical protein H2200_002618 [Cladophialophora chaetospira]|uniref:DUF1168 domain protein n=1 Tax=Cladophialophora chaetospira TaxID=386627 RepID=A0AA39CMA2_9EURO|nr:hypothetical protein H2200_002618 [Cladophialophora chaetospira]
MSEPIPESIPTSADPRSHRPIKRARGSGANNPAAKALSSQANEISSLMLDPAREVKIPPTSSENKKSIAAPPEIVANVQGSSAGAGSGEFHVYKASRRREYERLRAMDEEAKKEEEEKEWAEKERERKEKDEEKTRKNRERRNKRKGKDKSRSPAVAEKGDGANGKSVSEKKPGGKLAVPRREDGDDTAQTGTDFGVAEVVKENGITIHDDD